jgi:hypothetical protein
MNAKLEIAKAAGCVEIIPGFKLFLKEYFTKGRVVELDSCHWVRVAGNGFTQPFIFIASCKLSGGEPDIAECESEEMAIQVIEAICKSAYA